MFAAGVVAVGMEQLEGIRGVLVVDVVVVGDAELVVVLAAVAAGGSVGYLEGLGRMGLVLLIVQSHVGFCTKGYRKHRVLTDSIEIPKRNWAVGN